ncbi:hypothetical protein HPP92_014105 [Vanilla planifolia]|uniref:Bulb-type lectin domain-containing protein n=1 Tax=Vanilla planifolia TaxID=51239 RepID=A0A835UVE0_VANPL|nr:hypothetical protein HPP92_014105 [Vanilla planifolia]
MCSSFFSSILSFLTIRTLLIPSPAANPSTATKNLYLNWVTLFLVSFLGKFSSKILRWHVVQHRECLRTHACLGCKPRRPCSDPSSSELKLSKDGNLVLLNQSKSIIWSTNANFTSTTTVAVLLDSGNLVLKDGSDPSRVLWQSFDHPTNTWLPGGKLGLNKLNGENQHLVSWKNAEDPAPGLFYLELDPNEGGQYIILWNGTKNYWSSGPWNGKIFSGVPEMTSSYVYDFEYVNNGTENYFTYTVNSDDVISRFIMDYSGQIKQLTWVPSSNNWILFWSQPRAQCSLWTLRRFWQLQ